MMHMAHSHEYVLSSAGTPVSKIINPVIVDCSLGHSGCLVTYHETGNILPYEDGVAYTSEGDNLLYHTHFYTCYVPSGSVSTLIAFADPATINNCSVWPTYLVSSFSESSKLATSVSEDEVETSPPIWVGKSHYHTILVLGYVFVSLDNYLPNVGSLITCDYGHDYCVTSGFTYIQYLVSDTLVESSTSTYEPLSYPSDSVTRVSSIRRIYRPGLYRMEVSLGDLGFDVDVSEVAISKVADEVKEPEIPSEEPAKLPEPLTTEDWTEIVKQQQAMTQPLPTWATHTTTPYQGLNIAKNIKPSPTDPISFAHLDWGQLQNEWKVLKGKVIRTAAETQRMNLLWAEITKRYMK